MKVLNWKKSLLSEDLIIASIECDKCGHVGQVSCENLSELHHSICSKCGHISVERKDGLLYKDTKKIVGNDSSYDTDDVVREGLERLIRIYNKGVRTGKIDTKAFPDKETFVRWSIDRGYRDWKTVRPADGEQLIDENARWIVCSSGVSGYGTKVSLNARQGNEYVAKGIGMCAIEGVETIDIALSIVDRERERWEQVRNNENISELENRLRRIQTEFNDILNELDLHF